MVVDPVRPQQEIRCCHAVPMRRAKTGATGFLDGETARQLRSSGHELLAAGCDPRQDVEPFELPVDDI